MKLILLNGPPQSGKDTARLAIESGDKVPFTFHAKFSMPIKRAFAGMMDVPCDQDGIVYQYEVEKDKPIPVLDGILGGNSFRQWQINFSEYFMKPLYGEDIFARLLLTELEEQQPDCVIVSDCGFQVEVDYLCTRLPIEAVYLVQIWRDGTSFTGDSRQWVTPTFPTTKFLKVVNDDKAKFEQDMIDLAISHFGANDA